MDIPRKNAGRPVKGTVCFMATSRPSMPCHDLGVRVSLGAPAIADFIDEGSSEFAQA
jgi:hypothetical protein